MYKTGDGSVYEKNEKVILNITGYKPWTKVCTYVKPELPLEI